MDLQSLRGAVRDALEVDVEEIPDPMLDRWLEEGFDRILDHDQRWSFLEYTWTYNWVGGVQSVDLDAVSGDAPIRQLASITVPTDRTLNYVGHDAAEMAYTLSTSAHGTPVEWSVYGNRLYLWPSPAADVVLNLRGYREPTPFYELSAGAEPDLPQRMHKLLVTWAMHMAYERDEDPEMSSYHRQHFDDALFKAQRSDRALPPAQPLVMGGAPRRFTAAAPKFPFA